MSDARDPSAPRGGSMFTADLAAARAMLRDRITRSSYTDSGLDWGFALTGQDYGGSSPAGYGYIVAVTLEDAIALTPALVAAAKTTSLYLMGCARTTLSVPAVCTEMRWAEHSTLPAVASRSLLGCTRALLGGGHLEATIEWDQAARTPVVFLSSYPIPGWPR